MTEGNAGKVPARHGKAVRLSQGQALKIINIHGHQVVDTWAFNASDPAEFISLEHTRGGDGWGKGKLFVEKGDALLTNKRRPMLTLEEDTAAMRHDTLIAACDTYRYSQMGCRDYHENCTDNLRIALRNIGFAATECPSPLNLWMYFPVDDAGIIHWGEPKLKKGDYVILRAHMDCVVVMSCCPMDIVSIHGDGAKPVDVDYEVLV